MRTSFWPLSLQNMCGEMLSHTGPLHNLPKAQQYVLHLERVALSEEVLAALNGWVRFLWLAFCLA
jgi:hypothetical protein